MIYMFGYDCTDVWDLTKAEMEGRRQALLAIEVLRRYVPGFEKAKLRNFGMTLGTRDSRQIVGRYNLTGHDVRNQARFEDSIGIFPEFLDAYGVLSPADHRPLLPGPFWHHGATRGAKPAGRRALRCRRPDVACSDPQHDVLHGDRPGRRRSRRCVYQGWYDLRPGEHQAPPERAAEAGRPHLVGARHRRKLRRSIPGRCARHTHALSPIRSFHSHSKRRSGQIWQGGGL